ncbi:hypothetical protein BOX15_Mlig005034g1 [Macrostomum lignano]|nr:hypothetical protein BOX15_Mlig005034g1 [Macrostomum lignano]
MEPLLSRKRRQTYTSYPTVKVLIMVSDTNDNAPLFKYPVYPNRTSTQNKYFAAVDMFAPANTRAITVNATDADLGRNAEVSYAPNAWTTATPPNPPFLLSDADGSVRTAATFNRNSTIKYRFGVIAQDNGLPVRLSSSTELIVNLIQDKNRMILVVPGPNKEPKVTIPSLETIRRTLQTATGQVVLIERVNPRQYLEGSTIRDDPTGTDIWFVCVNPVTYDICVRDDAEPTNAFMTNEAKEKIRNMLNGVVPMETIRAPFGVTTGQLAFKKTSDILYQYGFASDVWAALIAIAAFIILMCIIVIVYCLVRRPRDPRFLAARANPYDIYAASQIGSHVGPVSLAASEINGHGGAKIDDIEEQCLEYNIESVPAQEQITPQEQPEYVQIREPNTSSFINPRFQGMSELVSYH